MSPVFAVDPRPDSPSRPEVKLFQFISSLESIYVFKNGKKFIAVVCHQLESWAYHTNHHREIAEVAVVCADKAGIARPD